MNTAMARNADPHKPALIVRMIDRFADWKENRPRHAVNRRKYLLLLVFTGWLGGHRFYEKRWKLGLLYLLLAVTALPAAMAVVDFMIAVPMKPDANGNITL